MVSSLRGEIQDFLKIQELKEIILKLTELELN